ncbi:Na-translocating system protein MpsC family protein [Caloramator sp. mosi_1]|nr:Na-translocating system protein MpsC family protein [Caloramator sp. mosi_1]WDC84689.1 Na-translocating system protein MpsC family protein [Caloramator sp. mosi_1]
MSLKGSLEMKISNALIHFEKEEIGRGAEEAMAHIFKDMIIVRLKKVLTPAEKDLLSHQRGEKPLKNSGICLRTF